MDGKAVYFKKVVCACRYEKGQRHKGMDPEKYVLGIYMYMYREPGRPYFDIDTRKPLKYSLRSNDSVGSVIYCQAGWFSLIKLFPFFFD